MVDILHRVGIGAPVSEVYEALSTTEGLAGWWTTEIKGDAGAGGQLAFHFGSPEPSAVMAVESVTPDRQVAWRCVDGPAEWLDTTVTFDLAESDGETVIRFAHAGWREPVEFMSHCSTKWAYFLLGLKDGFEGGKATPFPDDRRISTWG
jgi:uncharacterized protein YndB with AHSA1/START domain